MSHPTGTYLGGIRTVETLRQRCRVDEITHCWHWSLALNDGKVPKVHVIVDGKRVSMRGRRAALYLARGTDLPKGHVAFAILACASLDCVNPAHARSGTRKQHGEWLCASGRSEASPAKVLAARATAAKRRRLTEDAVQDIRTSNLSLVKLAEKHGVSKYACWAVRVGKNWRTGVKHSSVFAWAFGQRQAA